MYTCEFPINAKLVKEGSFRINAKLVKEELTSLCTVSDGSQDGDGMLNAAAWPRG